MEDGPGPSQEVSAGLRVKLRWAVTSPGSAAGFMFDIYPAVEVCPASFTPEPLVCLNVTFL